MILLPLERCNFELVEAVLACVGELNGVTGAQVGDGQLEVTAEAGITENDLIAALWECGLHFALRLPVDL